MLRCFEDGKNNALQILHHIIIGESKHTISAGCKPLIAAIIVADALFEIVAFAVDFDDELAGVRDEIGDVIAHRALPTKCEPGEPVSFQVAPQQGFRARHRAS